MAEPARDADGDELLEGYEDMIPMEGDSINPQLTLEVRRWSSAGGRLVTTKHGLRPSSSLHALRPTWARDSTRETIPYSAVLFIQCLILCLMSDASESSWARYDLSSSRSAIVATYGGSAPLLVRTGSRGHEEEAGGNGGGGCQAAGHAGEHQPSSNFRGWLHGRWAPSGRWHAYMSFHDVSMVPPSVDGRRQG